jgi:hypothetical protein
MADRADERYEPLTPAERALLADVRAAESLDALGRVVGESSPHEAYLTAKELWTPLRERDLGPPDESSGPPAATVTVGETTVYVHGITHADTDAERSFLREHVADYLSEGASVYCEQGIRSMYFHDLPAVCEMDDYRWAIAECRRLDAESNVADLVGSSFSGLDEELIERWLVERIVEQIDIALVDGVLFDRSRGRGRLRGRNRVVVRFSPAIADRVEALFDTQRHAVAFVRV